MTGSPARFDLQMLRELSLDALALRVLSALEESDVPALLLKGPVTQQLLYDTRAEHPYDDVDILVPPSSQREASAVMAACGLRDHHASVLGIYRPPFERAWLSEDAAVDLHTGIEGIPGGARELAWRRFHEDADSFDLRNRSVPIMGARGRALHLALHAAQRLSGPKALRDLRRGLERMTPEVWHQAADLAEELGAQAAFSSGLRAVPEGVLLLGRLGQEAAPSVEALLHERGVSAEALAFARLKGQPNASVVKALGEWMSLDDPTARRLQVWRRRTTALARLPKGWWEWRAAQRGLPQGKSSPRR